MQKEIDERLKMVEDGEPIFVLRGSESSSSTALLEWIRQEFFTASEADLMSAFVTALEMRRYNRRHLLTYIESQEASTIGEFTGDSKPGRKRPEDYHRLVHILNEHVGESFDFDGISLLCRTNGIQMNSAFWQRVRRWLTQTGAVVIEGRGTVAINTAIPDCQFNQTPCNK